MNYKKELRRYYKELRLGMSSDERKEADRQIAKRLLESEQYKSCEMFLCFVSTDIEVSTREILRSAFSEKTVLCPRCVGSPKDGMMHFYKVRSFDELEESLMGILEPPESLERTERFENALCILPGLAFDKEGFRLGFGGGYYDRFLTGFEGVKLGICYENCVCERLSHNGFDIKADMLITDKNTYRFTGER